MANILDGVDWEARPWGRRHKQLAKDQSPRGDPAVQSIGEARGGRQWLRARRNRQFHNSVQRLLAWMKHLPSVMAVVRARTAMQLRKWILRQRETPSDCGMVAWPRCCEDMCRGRTISTACLQHYCLSCQMRSIEAMVASCQHC